MKTLGHYFVLSSLCLCTLTTNLTACGPSSVHHVSAQVSASINHAVTHADGFSMHSGDGYTISYPKGWQFSTNTTNTGGYVGDFFTDPTRGYVFHVYPSQDQTSAATILNQFLTGDIRSRLLPIAATITVNGVVWQQGKALTTDQVTGKPLEKIGWVAKNALAPQHIPYFVLHVDGDPAAFDQYTNTYFLPMLRSFQFTK